MVEYHKEGLNKMEDKKKDEEVKAEKAADTKFDEGIELSDDELDQVSGGSSYAYKNSNKGPVK